MNVQEMYDYVYGVLNSDEETDTRAEVLRYLNDAQDELYHQIVSWNDRFLETSAFVDEVSGTQEHALPVGIYKLIHIMRHRTRGGSALEDPIELYKIPAAADEIERVGWDKTLGLAEHQLEGYYINGMKEFVIIPTPTTTQTAAFEVTYIYEPKALVADSDIPFSDATPTAQQGLNTYHKLLPMKAAQMIAGLEENPIQGALSQKIQKWEYQLGEHLAQLDSHQFGRVQVVDDDEEYWTL